MFVHDLFSNSIPAFKQPTIDVSELLKNILAENYSNISNDIICIEQFQGNEINSNNYKVTTASGIYLIKKFIDIHDHNKLQRVLLTNNWLHDNNIKFGKVHSSNKGELVVKSKVENSFWCIFDFINGSFFTGKTDRELISVSSEIGVLFNKLEKVPMDLYPVDRIEHFINYDYLMDNMEKNKNNWTVYFNKDVSLVLDQNWDFLKNIYSKLIENKDMILSIKSTPTHIDLHPHNILVFEDKIKSILDVDSIKLDYTLVSISFSMYKLLKQTIITRGIQGNTGEIARVTKLYFNSLIKKVPIIEKEKLYIYSVAEIFRRIFIIFSLNIYQNDKRWNHVLKIHLDGLKEAKIIFDSLEN